MCFKCSGIQSECPYVVLTEPPCVQRLVARILSYSNAQYSQQLDRIHRDADLSRLSSDGARILKFVAFYSEVAAFVFGG